MFPKFLTHDVDLGILARGSSLVLEMLVKSWKLGGCQEMGRVNLQNSNLELPPFQPPLFVHDFVQL